MSSLAHHGILGMKWGVRRFQNPDGTRTQAGKRRDLETRRTRRATKSKAIVDSIIASMNDEDRDLLNVGDDGYLSVEQGKYVAKRILVKDDKGEYVSFVDLLEDGNGLNGIVGTKSGDNYRGKGYASKATKEALDWYDKNADKYGYTKLVVGAKKRNVKSQGLAEKSNFEKTSSDDDWVVYEYKGKKVKHSSIGGNMNYIYGNTLVLGDSSYLEHHGIKNQKWGVRRFQNPDGSLTAAGRIRYGVTGAGKAVSKATKAVFNTGKTAGTKLVTSAKKAVAAKKEKDLAAKKEKVSKNRDSVLKNKDLFTSQELAELEKRFKVEDDMKFASMRKGQEIAKTISTYGDAAVKVLNAAQTGGKAVSAISAAMGSMDQLKENREIRGKAAAEDMSFEDYKAYTKAKTEAKINNDFKNKNRSSSDDDDHDIPVVPVDYDDNPPPGGPGGGGSGGGPRTPTGGGPGGTDQNRVHRLTSDQQKKIVSFRTKKPKRDEDDVGDVSEEDVNKYKKASKDADSKAKSAQQNADNLKSKRDQLDAAIRNFKLPPLNNPNYDAAAAQLRAAHKQSADLQAAYKKAQSEADSARVAAYNAQREALASEYGGSKGKRIANDMAKKLSDKEYQHAVNAIDSQRESDKSGYDRNVAKAYLKDALNPKNIANRTIDKAAGKIADKAINKQKEALAKERDKQQKQMAENFQRSMKAGTLDASKGIRDYYQREFGLHGAQLDKAVNNYMDSHSGNGSKRTIDLSSYHDKRSSELAKKSASLSNREAAVSEREAVAGQREENIRVARQTLRAASDYLKGASEKVYNDSTIKEEQLHEINEHIRKMMGKRAAVHSDIGNFSTDSYLSHHGIKGQKWGVRRYQNPDGTLTPDGLKRKNKLKRVGEKDLARKAKQYGTINTYDASKIQKKTKGFSNVDSDTEILSKDTTIHRIATKDESIDFRRKYVSFTEKDKATYEFFGKVGELGLPKEAEPYAYQYRLTKDLRIANGKAIEKYISNELKKSKVKVRDVDGVSVNLVEAFDNHRENEAVLQGVIKKYEHTMTVKAGSKQSFDVKKVGAEANATVQAYREVIKEYMEGDPKKVAKLAAYLKKNGYDAYVDMVDARSAARWKWGTEYPLVIMNPKDTLELKKVTSLRHYDYEKHALAHHGIPGQRWGIRRFQNKDGTRTAAGKKREKDYAAKNNSVREKFYYTDGTVRKGASAYVYKRGPGVSSKYVGSERVGSTRKQAKAEAAAEALLFDKGRHGETLSDRDRKRLQRDVRKGNEELAQIKTLASATEHQNLHDLERYKQAGNRLSVKATEKRLVRDRQYFEKADASDLQTERNIYYGHRYAAAIALGIGSGLASSGVLPAAAASVAVGTSIVAALSSVATIDVHTSAHRDARLRNGMDKMDSTRQRDKLRERQEKEAERERKKQLRSKR